MNKILCLIALVALALLSIGFIGISWISLLIFFEVPSYSNIIWFILFLGVLSTIFWGIFCTMSLLIKKYKEEIGIDKKRIAKKSMLFMLPITLFLAGAYILNFITYRDYEEKGQNLIDKVECYKKTHNRLPQNVGEMGMTETEGVGPYYFKDDSTHYRIIFSFGFDTSYTYSSDTQKWENVFTLIHQF